MNEWEEGFDLRAKVQLADPWLSMGLQLFFSLTHPGSFFCTFPSLLLFSDGISSHRKSWAPTAKVGGDEVRKESVGAKSHVADN